MYWRQWRQQISSRFKPQMGCHGLGKWRLSSKNWCHTCPQVVWSSGAELQYQTQPMERCGTEFWKKATFFSNPVNPFKMFVHQYVLKMDVTTMVTTCMVQNDYCLPKKLLSTHPVLMCHAHSISDSKIVHCLLANQVILSFSHSGCSPIFLMT